jgi:hypothetical protein
MLADAGIALDLVGYDLLFECAVVAMPISGFGINVERHLSVVQICQPQFQLGAHVRCALSIWRPQRRDSRHGHSHLDAGSFVGDRASWRFNGWRRRSPACRSKIRSVDVALNA